MKVKINDTIYNSEEQPIMVILSSKDKENISKMPTDNGKYCGFPNTPYFNNRNHERIKAWMEIK